VLDVRRRRPLVAVAAQGPALRLSPRYLVEDLLALAGELHQHHRSGLGIDVGARPGELQLITRHLGNRVIREVLHVVVLEEVEPRRPAARHLSGAVRGHAADGDGVVRDGQDRPVLGHMLAKAAPRLRFADDVAREELRARRRWPRLDDVLVVEEVPLRSLALVREHAGGRIRQQVVEGPPRIRRGVEQTAGHRRTDHVGLEVVELEHRRLANQRRRIVHVVNAGELDDDLVRALLPDLRLGHAELVDAVPHDVDRPTEIFRRELVALRRHRFQDDLEAALEVEAQRQLLMDRRTWDHQKGDADERRQDAADEDQMATAIFQAESGGSVAGASSTSGVSSGSSSSLTTPATARLAIRTSTPSAISSRTSSPSTAVTLP